MRDRKRDAIKLFVKNESLHSAAMFDMEFRAGVPRARAAPVE